MTRRATEVRIERIVVRGAAPGPGDRGRLRDAVADALRSRISPAAIPTTAARIADEIVASLGTASVARPRAGGGR